MGVYKLTQKQIIGTFFARLAQNPGLAWINELAFFQTSTQAKEDYSWLGQVPMMREWVGGRHAKGLTEESYEIPNLDFEATLEIDTADLRRDKTGQILVRVKELADRANAHWAKILSALIIAGESKACYDGQYFFDTDHTEGDSGTQNNIVAPNIVTPTAPTAAEMESAILSGVSQILGFKDNEGEAINEDAKNFRVMVPTTFMTAALAALKNPVIVDGSGSRTNTIASIDGFNLALDINPRLSWTTKFAVFRSDGLVKPFIKQEEVPVEMNAIAEGSELEFKYKKHQYGVSASRNVGFGMWQHAALVSFT